MPTYIRKGNDVKYRKVSLKSNTIPPFSAFVSHDEGIAYTEDQVIEVEDRDGNCSIFYDYPKLGTPWKIGHTAEGSRVTISTDVPLARLWMNVNGALYKIPVNLPVENGCYYFIVSLPTEDFKIEGDRYFMEACI